MRAAARSWCAAHPTSSSSKRPSGLASLALVQSAAAFQGTNAVRAGAWTGSSYAPPESAPPVSSAPTRLCSSRGHPAVRRRSGVARSNLPRCACRPRRNIRAVRLVTVTALRGSARLRLARTAVPTPRATDARFGYFARRPRRRPLRSAWSVINPERTDLARTNAYSLLPNLAGAIGPLRRVGFFGRAILRV